jgi:alpha-L-fucosidase 2
MEIIQSLFLLFSIANIPYDEQANKWLFDPQTIVSRNDVLYTTPSVEPWEAMPTGGGDLSAMVRCNGSLHLHLTKSDSWGYQAPPDALHGTRFFNNVSPGHIYMDFGKRAEDEASKFFRQRLDLYHGRIIINLGSEDNGASFEIWGHPNRKIIIVEVSDPNSILNPAKIELSEWRETMKIGFSPEIIYASEVQTRPASPNLANTGMQDYFKPEDDPMLGRGTAVMIASPSLKPDNCNINEKTAVMVLPDKRPQRYYFIIASAVTKSGDPLTAAKREIDEAMSIPLEKLKAEHQAWWSEYWSRSFLRIQSPDKKADWLCSAYHVHLYTLACVNQGAYPAKWDGGAGLMRNDERTWGLSEWVQEVRFTYLPLYAANQLDIAEGLYHYYSDMIPYLTKQTKKMWGISGLWIPETVLPWGHAEDFSLYGSGANYFHNWEPENAPYGLFKQYNPYIGFLFTSGLEICQYYLTYYLYSGDETFLCECAYPVIRGVCEFISGLLRKGDDGYYHLDPANALETWWMVRDPADTLDGIRAIFPEFVKLSEKYGQDAELHQKCTEILSSLPEPSYGLWTEDSRIDPDIKVYAPATAKGKLPNRSNAENPALYRIFPFGLSGIESSDYDLALNTFNHRICNLGNGWSMDAIWAARLGLSDIACDLLSQHAMRYNRFRYGGWDSNDSSVFPDGLSVVPFTDAGGLSAFALNEILLQSHKGIIRAAPAVAENWSGIFQLRAEGGFIVSADFQGQNIRFVEVRSLLGKDCIIENPWQTPCVIREGQKILIQSDEKIIRFHTRPDGTYILENADNPISRYQSTVIEDEPNLSPGMPGRD